MRGGGPTCGLDEESVDNEAEVEGVQLGSLHLRSGSTSSRGPTMSRNRARQ